MALRLAIVFVLFTSFPNLVFSQKLLEDLYDLYTPELISENNIYQVNIEVNSIEKEKLTFNKQGQVETDIEFKNWATGDTTIKYYTYSNNLKTQVIHLDFGTGDTLSYDNFNYNNEKVLVGIEGMNSTNNTKTDFWYYENGFLKESLMVMTFSIGGDTSRVDHSFYDELGRKMRLERTHYNGSVEVTHYVYNENTIDVKKRNEVTKELYVSSTMEFNKELRVTKVINFKPSTLDIQDVLIIEYSETGLVKELNGKENTKIKFTYQYY